MLSICTCNLLFSFILLLHHFTIFPSEMHSLYKMCDIHSLLLLLFTQRQYFYFFSKSSICMTPANIMSANRTGPGFRKAKNLVIFSIFTTNLVFTFLSFWWSHFISTKTAETFKFSKMVLFQGKNKTHLQTKVCVTWHVTEKKIK